jgi:hypothetical protein
VKRWQKLCVVLFVISLIGFRIIQNSESRAVIQNGSVNEFWYVVCGVDVDGSFGDPGWMAGPDAVRGEWAYYSILGHCGDMFHRVRLDEAAIQLPGVVKLIVTQRLKESLSPVRERAFESWIMTDGSATDVANLVEAMLAARLKHMEETEPDRVQYVHRAERVFDATLERSKRYWMTQLFEFTWLSGVVLLIAYPWLRNSGRLSWSICLGIAPLVLYFPNLCGYALYTFSSCFPDGGIFYPDVVRWLPCISPTRVDVWLNSRFPPMFDWLAQLPHGNERTRVDRAGTGPVGLVAVGLIPAILLYFVWPNACTMSQRLGRSHQASHETINPSVDDSSN